MLHLYNYVPRRHLMIIPKPEYSLCLCQKSDQQGWRRQQELRYKRIIPDRSTNNQRETFVNIAIRMGVSLQLPHPSEKFSRRKRIVLSLVSMFDFSFSLFCNVSPLWALTCLKTQIIWLCDSCQLINSFRRETRGSYTLATFAVIFSAIFSFWWMWTGKLVTNVQVKKHAFCAFVIKPLVHIYQREKINCTENHWKKMQV